MTSGSSGTSNTPTQITTDQGVTLNIGPDTQAAAAKLKALLAESPSQQQTPDYFTCVFIALMDTVQTLGSQGQAWNDWLSDSSNSQQVISQLVDSFNPQDITPTNAADTGQLEVMNSREQAQASNYGSLSTTQQTTTQTDTSLASGVTNNMSNTVQAATSILSTILQILNLNRF